MKPYPKYKESGIEWVGKVPEHWEVKKLKNTDEVIMGQSPSSEDYNHTYTGLPFLQGNAEFTNIHPIPKIWCGTANKIAIKGDVLLSVRAPVGAVNIADQIYAIGRGLCAIRANKSNKKYLYYIFISLNDELNSIGTGSTYTAISVDEVRNVILPCPPFSEQSNIDFYISRKTSQIDTLIEKKQKLIELLKEYRIAIINQAVTKGLNPDVPMKDSGIEWLGEVPEHWIITKLGYLCRNILDGPHFSPSYLDEGILFLSARNIKVDRWSLDDAKYISLKDYQEFCKRITPEIGDILYTKGGTTGIARVVDLEEPFQVWVHVAVLKLLKNKVTPYFLTYSLNSPPCYEQSQLYTRGATNNDLGLARMANIILALPPIIEQEVISEYLKSKTSKLNSIIDKQQQQIDLLKEYRTTLISDVVTGKIDVRGEI